MTKRALLVVLFVVVRCEGGPRPNYAQYELKQERARCNSAALAFKAQWDCTVTDGDDLTVYSPPRVHAKDGPYYSISVPYDHAAWEHMRARQGKPTPSLPAAYREGAKHESSANMLIAGYTQADEVCGMLGHRWGAAWWTVHQQNAQEQLGHVFRACPIAHTRERWSFCLSTSAHLRCVLGSVACRPPPRVGDGCVPGKSRALHTRCYMKDAVLRVHHDVKPSKYHSNHQHKCQRRVSDPASCECCDHSALPEPFWVAPPGGVAQLLPLAPRTPYPTPAPANKPTPAPTPDWVGRQAEFEKSFGGQGPAFPTGAPANLTASDLNAVPCHASLQAGECHSDAQGFTEYSPPRFHGRKFACTRAETESTLADNVCASLGHFWGGEALTPCAKGSPGCGGSRLLQRASGAATENDWEPTVSSDCSVQSVRCLPTPTGRNCLPLHKHAVRTACAVIDGVVQVLHNVWNESNPLHEHTCFHNGNACECCDTAKALKNKWTRAPTPANGLLTAHPSPAPTPAPTPACVILAIDGAHSLAPHAVPGYHLAEHVQCRYVHGVVRVKHLVHGAEWQEDGHLHRCIHNGKSCICCDRDTQAPSPWSDDDDKTPVLPEVLFPTAKLSSSAVP